MPDSLENALEESDQMSNQPVAEAVLPCPLKAQQRPAGDWSVVAVGSNVSEEESDEGEGEAESSLAAGKAEDFSIVGGDSDHESED